MSDNLKNVKPDEKPINSEAFGISIEEYCKLADKFASQEMYDEAIEIYNKAVTYYPNDLFLKINYSRFLEMKFRNEREFWRKNEDKIQKLRRNDDTMCNHYVGLGELYLRQKKISKAIEAFEFAKFKNNFSYLPYLKLGEIYFGQKSYDESRKELLKAKALNKFDEKIYILLGKISFQRKNFEDALANFVDASILSGKHFKETAYQREIRIAFEKAVFKEKLSINQYVRSRSAVFIKLMEIINRQKGKDIENIGAEHIREIIDRFKEKKFQDELIAKVERLRQCILVQELSEAELYRIGMIAEPMDIDTGAVIFKEFDPGGRLFLVDHGEVKISRILGVGERNLATFPTGSYFGEMDFIDNLKRSTDAITTKRWYLFCIERDDLLGLFEMHKKIAVKILIVFWKTLALRIRDSNEMLKSFFDADGADHQVEKEEVIERDRRVEVELETKIDLFRDKGLSERDLKVLLLLTKEELFNQNELIFSEGDEGDTLYFILDGRIRVTKNIPGVGDEAIAIMERGDFFGEMSLVDNTRRSADCRAHEGSATILAISKQTIDHIISAEIETAYQFLGILCRSLSRRLRKINDMICSWHVMSGGF